MDAISLGQLADWCGGVLENGNREAVIRGISKDTRTLAVGSVYFALRGENHDGHAFLAQAAQAGSVAAVVDSAVRSAPGELALVRVQDSLQALQNLAAAWRESLTLKVVCITGSSGKTSTKDFAASVLSQRFQTSKTQGNLNNHIGLPLTILSSGLSDQAAVWEVGMSHRGEIAPLAALARPDVAIITGIGTAHIEYLGSREAIADEKGDLAAALGPDGVLILRDEDDFSDRLAARTCGRVVRVGIRSGDLSTNHLVATPGGMSFEVVTATDTVAVKLPVMGEHMAGNALLAMAAGLEFGLSLEECAAGIAATKLAGGRLQPRMLRGVHFLDDTYNANPDSMTAALDALASIPGGSRRFAVLGKMGELGDHAEAGYRKVGKRAAGVVQGLIVVGRETRVLAEAAEAAGLRTVLCADDQEEAAELLRDQAVAGDVVLVKGSRSARMEDVIRFFE